MSGDNIRTQARLVEGRFQLLRELGRGGMGVVWLADDLQLYRRVAVKELRPPPGLSPDGREACAKRALREARSAARIQHPNAVTLYHSVPATADDDAVYLIMEFIDGPTLAQLIRANGPLPDTTVATWGIQLLDVLQTAHGLGIVHRDIKPANIMITADNQVKLTDFGIAHTIGDPRLTHSGTMGTQAYMAPERFSAAPITPAADLWSLGATLCHAAQGQGPFDRDTTEAILRAILIDDIPAPHCAPALAHAITALLRRDPERRATIPQARTQLLAATKPPADTTDATPRPPSHPVQPPPRSTQPRSRADMTARPDTRARPTADTTTFTNMPNAVARSLVTFSWVIGLVIFFLATLKYEFAFVFAGMGAYWLFLISRIIKSFWFTVTLSPEGLTAEHGIADRYQKRIVNIPWNQIVRIGTMKRGFRRYLCVWVPVIGRVREESVRLCPLGSPHFPVGVILAEIQRRHPTVAIEPGWRQ
jgi:serine/threonine protein kinase